MYPNTGLTLQTRQGSLYK